MEISSLWNVFFISAFSQGFFIAIVLFIQFIKTKQISQLFLGLFIAFFSYVLVSNTVYWNQMYTQYPHVLFVTLSIRYTLAPLFFLYCLSYLRVKFKVKHLLHFIPFLVIFLIYAPIIFLSGDDKIGIISGTVRKGYAWMPMFGNTMFQLLSLHLLTYAAINLFKIKRRQVSFGNGITKEQLNQLNWLKFLNSLFALYGGLMLLYFILIAMDVGGIENDYFISLAMCAAIYSVSYIGIFNPELLKGVGFIEKVTNPKYIKTRLSNESLENTMGRVLDTMENDRLYLDADISLADVAKKLEIPKHHITQALSLLKGRSFVEFVNGFRIRHAQHLLRNLSDGDNIKTIMHSSGFNNRVSFNNNFKKIVGMTASEFVKCNKVSEVTLN